MEQYRHLILRYRINSLGCWVHKNKSNKDGYVNLCFRGHSQTNVLAHRASYQLHIGDIPEGMLVCHICDTPKCINPKHLFLGTPADNVADRDAKNRTAKGERSPHTKLTVKQREEIVKKLWTITSIRSIAQEYNVSETTIYKIKSLNKIP